MKKFDSTEKLPPLEQAKLLFKSIRQLLSIAYHAAPSTFVWGIVVHVLAGLHPVATAYITKLLFDLMGQVLQGETVDFQASVLPLLVIQAIILVFAQILNLVDSHLNEILVQRTDIHAQRQIFNQLWRLQGLQYFESPELHDTIRLATDNLRWGPRQALNNVNALLTSTVRNIGFLGVLWVFSPILVLLVFVTAGIMLYVRMWTLKHRLNLSWENSPKERKSHYLSGLLVHQRYATELRLFNLGDYFQKQHEQIVEEVFVERMAIVRKERWLLAGVYLLQTGILIAAWGIVVSQVFARSITIGDVSFYLQALQTVQGNLQAIMNSIADLNEHAAFYTHYRNLMNLENDLPHLEPHQSMPVLAEGLELRNVSFRYTESSPYVLKNVNLCLKKANRWRWLASMVLEKQHW